MKILIVRLSSFGDVVHTFPALSDLSRARPDIEVDWLIDESFAGFAGLHPAVGNVIAYAERRLRWPPTRWPARLRARAQLRRSLRENRYDLVVDLQGLLKSAGVGCLAGSPMAGYDRRSIREPLASRRYQRVFPVAKDIHAVERNRRLLAASIDYEVPDTPGIFDLAPAGGIVPNALPERFCVLAHSASWPSKLWSERNWHRLIERITSEGFDVILPWGSAEEKLRAERLAAGSESCFVLPRRLDGVDLAAVIKRANFAVGLDSGLMHLATALNVPGVWLFGPTDQGLTGPYGENQLVIRSTNPNAPCRTRSCAHGPEGQSCMDAVAFDRVAAAVDTFLERTR